MVTVVRHIFIRNVMKVFFFFFFFFFFTDDLSGCYLRNEAINIIFGVFDRDDP